MDSNVTPGVAGQSNAAESVSDGPVSRSWTGRRAIGRTALVNAQIMVLGLVTSVTSARSLGPEGRGIFSIAWAASGFAVVVVGLGLSQAFAYLVSRDRRSARDAWKMTVYCGVGVGVPIALAGALAVALTVDNNTQANALMLALVALPFAIISADATGILQGLRSATAFNVSRLITPAAFAVLLLAWALTRPGSAVEAIGIYVIATALGMAGSIALLSDQLGSLRGISRPFAAAALRYGLVTNIASTAYVANRHLLLIALGFVASAADVGIFAVAMGYALPVSLVATAVALHTMPEIAARTDRDAQALLGRRRLAATVKITAPVTAAAIAAAPFLIPLAFGEPFSDAVEIAIVLVVAQSVFAVAFVLEETSRGLGRPAFPALAEAAGLVATILAAVLIVPTAGLTGVAVATVVVNALVGFVVYWRLRPFLLAPAG